MKTLVSKYVAREGYRFLFSGPLAECSNCRFKSACINNLESGVAYEIVKIYGIVNKCPALGEVVTVDVKPAEVEVALDSRAAIENVVTTYTYRNCGVPCRFSELCRNALIVDGSRVRVISIRGGIKCEIGRNLTRAVVVTVTTKSK
ncbi:MAG: UPF0179 family protein [Sulfolobales archaeon]|nr:UPF0179 family protein [Sulfolobales archaeon]MDW8083065.1 UPF0179 family protein [Sulfolobales archaeon]